MGFLDNLMGRNTPSAKSFGNFNSDPSGLAMSQFKKFDDPNYGMEQFQRIASNSGPSFADLQRSAHSQGMGGGLAAQQYNQGKAQATQQMTDSYGQFRLNSDQNASSMLGMHFQNNQSQQQNQYQAQLNSSQSRQQGAGNLLQMGTGLLGSALGGPLGGMLGSAIGGMFKG